MHHLEYLNSASEVKSLQVNIERKKNKGEGINRVYV
jgi:hypothetical protein